MLLSLLVSLALAAPVPAAPAPAQAAPAPAGIGAMMRAAVHDGLPAVVLPIPGSPADRGGLLAGDLVAAVDGWPTSGEALETVVARIGGAPGTEVVLTVLRDGERSEVRLLRAPTRDLGVAQAARERDLCPALVAAIDARADDFAAVIGSAAGEDTWEATPSLPTATSTRVEGGLAGRTWRATFGTYGSVGEGAAALTEVIERFRGCLRGAWLVPEVVDGLPVMHFGREHPLGWYSPFGAFRLGRDGVVEVYVERVDERLFHPVPQDRAPTGPWVSAMATVVAATPSRFEAIRGPAHTSGGPFSSVTWFEATTPLPGAVDSRVQEASLASGAYYECTIARGIDPATVGPTFDKAVGLVAATLGAGWLWWEDATAGAHDRSFVRFARRTTRGWEKTAVVTVGLSETGVTVSVSQHGVL